MNFQNRSILTLTATTITLLLAVNSSNAGPDHSTLSECLDYAANQCDINSADYVECMDFGQEDCEGSYLKSSLGLTAGQINRGKIMIRNRRNAAIRKWKLRQKSNQ